jgi:hypothetical protein
MAPGSSQRRNPTAYGSGFGRFAQGNNGEIRLKSAPEGGLGAVYAKRGHARFALTFFKKTLDTIPETRYI